MTDLEFWLRFGMLILSGGLFVIMILVSIILVEWNEFKKRRKENKNESS
jgi:hypothetical protein